MAEDYPDELNEILKSFEMARCRVDDVMKPLQTAPRSELIRTMKPLEIAKLDLVTAYTTNSLYWAYLTTQGINPKTHPVKQELDRIRTYMGKIKEIEDRKNAPKLKKEAAKRFIKHAMYDHSETSNKKVETEDNETVKETMNNDKEKKDSDINTKTPVKKHKTKTTKGQHLSKKKKKH